MAFRIDKVTSGDNARFNRIQTMEIAEAEKFVLVAIVGGLAMGAAIISWRARKSDAARSRQSGRDTTGSNEQR